MEYMGCPRCGSDKWARLAVTVEESPRNPDPLYRVCVCGHVYAIPRADATEGHFIERDALVYGVPYLTEREARRRTNSRPQAAYNAVMCPWLETRNTGQYVEGA